jgi:predicted TIM-barrel fold metal-dependent hydrolase
MIIDSHAHLEEEVRAEKILELMDRDGIQKVVLFAPAMELIPSTPDGLLAVFRFLLKSPLNPLGRRLYNGFVREGNLMVGGKAYRIFKDPDNEAVGKKVLEHPDRFEFYAFINPKGTRDSVEVLEACRSRFGVKGVKTHSWFHDFSVQEDLLPLARRCRDLGLPLLIHLGGTPKTGDIEGLLTACPGLKVILAHAGLPYFKRCWPLLDRHPNLFMDISGPYLNAGLVREVVRAVGSRRLLFGTDAPYGLRTADGYSFQPMLNWVRDLPIPDKEKEDIFSGNLLRLWG